jgi:hypothetical protein
LFTSEKSEELANIVQNIFQGKDNFFKWQKKAQETPEQQAADKYFGLVPKESAKNVGLIVLALLVIAVVYQTFKSKFSP